MKNSFLKNVNQNLFPTSTFLPSVFATLSFFIAIIYAVISYSYINFDPVRD